MPQTLALAPVVSKTNIEAEIPGRGDALQDFHDAWDDVLADRPRQKNRSGTYRRAYARALKLREE